MSSRRRDGMAFHIRGPAAEKLVAEDVVYIIGLATVTGATASAYM